MSRCQEREQTSKFSKKEKENNNLAETDIFQKVQREDWGKVIFSDEALFRLFGASG